MPTSIMAPIGHSGVSWDRDWNTQLFAVPSRYARNATPAAEGHDTRGASSSTGIGASHVSAATGVSPVPKENSTAEPSRAARARLRTEPIEDPPCRSLAQRAKVLFGQVDAT